MIPPFFQNGTEVFGEDPIETLQWYVRLWS
jgi:hypothetical protein